MIQRVLGFGVTHLFKGLRQGRPGLAGLSVAMAVFGWLRKRRRPQQERIYGANLRPGETVRIRFLKGDTVVDETEVAG